jgi:hypothetical protein
MLKLCPEWKKRATAPLGLNDSLIDRRLSRIHTSAIVSTFLAMIAFVTYALLFDELSGKTTTPILNQWEQFVYAFIILGDGLTGILSSFYYHRAAVYLENGMLENGVRIEHYADQLLDLTYFFSAGVLVFLAQGIVVLVASLYVIVALAIFVDVFRRFSRTPGEP